MTTLAAYAAFLTARWDELEKVGEYHSGDCDILWDDMYACDCDTTAFVLGDLAAKRAILDDIGHLFNEPDGLGNLVEGVLARLAEPFRSHPDHPANQEQP